MSHGVLQGIRILDFTWLLAGPYATRILADFGAEVIKVQTGKMATGAESNATGYFNTWNRNKLGITLNMAHPEGRKLALRLVTISDILVENFTPRVMAQWGLDYRTLSQIKPDIIMVSLSGFGQTGPWRDFAALGPTIQALSGMTHLTSSGNDPPEGIGYSYADPLSGMFTAYAVLAALEYRTRTGRGLYIDISEYEALGCLLGPALLDYSVNGTIAEPEGNTDNSLTAAPQGCYKCRGEDRWCTIAVFTDAEWHALCKVMGNPAWTEQERFASIQQRHHHAGELNRLVEQWTANYTPEQVMNRLQEAGVPAGVVNSAADLAGDPQLTSRDFFVHARHPRLGNTSFDSTPIRLSRTPPVSWKAAPRLGEHNHYVYRELLGLEEDEYQDYVNHGVIA